MCTYIDRERDIYMAGLQPDVLSAAATDDAQEDASSGIKWPHELSSGSRFSSSVSVSAVKSLLHVWCVVPVYAHALIFDRSA